MFRLKWLHILIPKIKIKNKLYLAEFSLNLVGTYAALESYFLK